MNSIIDCGNLYTQSPVDKDRGRNHDLKTSKKINPIAKINSIFNLSINCTFKASNKHTPNGDICLYILNLREIFEKKLLRRLDTTSISEVNQKIVNSQTVFHSNTLNVYIFSSSALPKKNKVTESVYR